MEKQQKLPDVHLLFIHLCKRQKVVCSKFKLSTKVRHPNGYCPIKKF